MGGRLTLPDMEAVYDAIAEPWARTRSGAWPAVTNFLAALPRGTLVVDVGVGSGRYLTVPEARGLRFVGLDFSKAQLAIARKVAGERADLVRADVRALPLCTASAPAALHVAVLHHLASRQERVASLRELHRLLRGGARALLSSWGLTAPVFSAARRAEGGGPHDFIVPFKEKLPAPADRFFHAYEAGELAAEAASAGFTSIRAWNEDDNEFVEVVR
jgi:SAM-dependent methyltransferase